MTTTTMPNGKELETSEHGFVSGSIKIDLSEAISLDLEGFLDLISVRLTGSDLLMDTSYEVIGSDEGEIVLKVSGDPSQIIEAHFGDDETVSPTP